MPTGRRAKLFNYLAVVCLGLSVVSVGWVISVTINPYAWFNPFPPAVNTIEPPERIVLVTATATLDSAPTGTLAPAPDFSPTATTIEETLEASSTPIPTITLSPTPQGTATPKPSPTRSAFTYTAVITLQVHPLQLCDWMGVAGIVTDLRGKPTLGAFVRVWGTGNVDQIVAAGANPIYGASGWEVRLARAQIVGSWKVQLVSSPEAKSPLSDVYAISMPGDCKKNLALVRFEQNH